MSEPTDIDNDEEAFAESTLIQAIENQIENDNPPAAKATFNKLTLVGYEREDILRDRRHARGRPSVRYAVVRNRPACAA